MIEALDLDRVEVEQLSLDERLIETDEAIIDSNSLAVAGVRRTIGSTVMDVEIFDNGLDYGGERRHLTLTDTY